MRVIVHIKSSQLGLKERNIRQIEAGMLEKLDGHGGKSMGQKNCIVKNLVKIVRRFPHQNSNLKLAHRKFASKNSNRSSEMNCPY
jgi:hypothetical protein